MEDFHWESSTFYPFNLHDRDIHLVGKDEFGGESGHDVRSSFEKIWRGIFNSWDMYCACCSSVF